MAGANINAGVVEKKMREYLSASTNGYGSSIVRSTIKANNFALKSAMLQMIQNSNQFVVLPSEDPN